MSEMLFPSVSRRPIRSRHIRLIVLLGFAAVTVVLFAIAIVGRMM